MGTSQEALVEWIHTACLRQEGSVGGGFLSRDVLDGKESQTVRMFLERSDFIMKLFLREGFFSFVLSSHQRASSAGLPSATLLATLWSI